MEEKKDTEETKEKAPFFYANLSPADQLQYQELRRRLSSKNNRYNRNKRIETFQDTLQAIQNFCVRNSEDDWKRFLVCGICWIDEGLCINTRQLRILLGKSKSSINGALQKIGYETVPSKGNDAAPLLSMIPYLKQFFTEQRQWTIRKLVLPGQQQQQIQQQQNQQQQNQQQQNQQQQNQQQQNQQQQNQQQQIQQQKNQQQQIQQNQQLPNFHALSNLVIKPVSLDSSTNAQQIQIPPLQQQQDHQITQIQAQGQIQKQHQQFPSITVLQAPQLLDPPPPSIITIKPCAFGCACGCDCKPNGEATKPCNCVYPDSSYEYGKDVCSCEKVVELAQLRAVEAKH